MTEKKELEIKTCKHLELGIKQESHSSIWLEIMKCKDADIGDLSNIRATEAICSLNKQPCVLYESGLSHIKFTAKYRCPSFKPTSRNYIAEGNVDETNFYLINIEEKVKA